MGGWSPPRPASLACGPCVLTRPFLCVCLCPTRSSHKDICHTGLGPTWGPHFTLVTSVKTRIFKGSHTWRSWESGLKRVNFGGHGSAIFLGGDIGDKRPPFSRGSFCAECRARITRLAVTPPAASSCALASTCVTGCPRCHRDSASPFLSRRTYTFSLAVDPNSRKDGEASSRRNGELRPPQRPRSMGSIQALQVTVPFLRSGLYVSLCGRSLVGVAPRTPRLPRLQTAQPAEAGPTPWVESGRAGVNGDLPEAGPPFPGGRGAGGAGMTAWPAARPVSCSLVL